MLELLERMAIKNVEFVELLTTCKCNSKALIEQIKQARESDDPEFIFEVADQLFYLKYQVWALADSKKISFYAMDYAYQAMKMSDFFAKKPDAYNLLSYMAARIRLELLCLGTQKR